MAVFTLPRGGVCDEAQGWTTVFGHGGGGWERVTGNLGRSFLGK